MAVRHALWGGVISAFSSFLCSAAATVMLSKLIVSSAMAHVNHEAEIGGSTYLMHNRVRPLQELGLLVSIVELGHAWPILCSAFCAELGGSLLMRLLLELGFGGVSSRSRDRGRRWWLVADDARMAMHPRGPSRVVEQAVPDRSVPSWWFGQVRQASLWVVFGRRPRRGEEEIGSERRRGPFNILDNRMVTAQNCCIDQVITVAAARHLSTLLLATSSCTGCVGWGQRAVANRPS
ncbi:hypothetical protein Dimus_004841 [Dionaea muscipula]